ncbi:MAG: FAD/FMN-containing dehydrogenase [Paracoccaceae bacterium]|jgi:FAD/FMN-containing dehydrogenase
MTLEPVTPDLIAKLKARIDPACFRDIDPKYLTEPRGLFKGVAGLVLAPTTVVEVSEIVQVCHAFGVGVIPYGGGTGLVGGQVVTDIPAPVILSLERMNKIRDLDAPGNVIIVEAGCVLSNIQEAADRGGRLFPLSLAAEGSCQIGGNLSTNAGGVGVLRYGSARDLCLGIEAVLPDGSIWNGLKNLRKDNTGYDIKNLLIGAEGSLGIITAASLKLSPKPDQNLAALLQIPNPTAALALLDSCRAKLGGAVSAFELINRQGLNFVAEKIPQVRLPFADPSEWMLLIDLGIVGDFDVAGQFENLLSKGIEEGLVLDALIAQNETQRQEFWKMREAIPEANRLVGAIYSHDISVPVGKIPAFIKQAGLLVAQIGAFRINCFGHVGDGNLHYNVYPPKRHSRDEFQAVRNQIKDSVYGLVDSLGGSISAEHGVGRMKIADMEKYCDATKLATIHAIKRALDPKGIMNPGAVVPLD